MARAQPDPARQTRQDKTRLHTQAFRIALGFENQTRSGEASVLNPTKKGNMQQFTCLSVRMKDVMA